MTMTDAQEICTRNWYQKNWYRFLVITCNLASIFFWYQILVSDRTCSIRYQKLVPVSGTGFLSVCHWHNTASRRKHFICNRQVWLENACSRPIRVSSGMSGNVLSPKICALARDDQNLNVIHGSVDPLESKSQTASQSVQPFCTDDRRVSLYFTMGRPSPAQNCPFSCGMWTAI